MADDLLAEARRKIEHVQEGVFPHAPCPIPWQRAAILAQMDQAESLRSIAESLRMMAGRTD